MKLSKFAPLIIFTLLLSNTSLAKVLCVPNGAQNSDAMSSLNQVLDELEELNHLNPLLHSSITRDFDHELFDIITTQIDRKTIFDFTAALKAENLMNSILLNCSKKLDIPLTTNMSQFCFVNAALLKLKAYTLNWEMPQNKSDIRIKLCPKQGFKINKAFSSAGVRG